MARDKLSFIPPTLNLAYLTERIQLVSLSDDYNDETYDSFGRGPIGSWEASNTEKCEMSVLGTSWVTAQPRPQHVMSTSCLQPTTDVAAAGLGPNPLYILLNDRETPMAMRPLKSSGPDLPISAPPVVVKPKACISCRTRKVKCDKSSPCTNCTLWSLECVYPSPIRRCPRPRKRPIAFPPDEGGGTGILPSLDERIQKVEKILKDLTNSINGQNGSASETNELGETSNALKEGTGDVSRLEALENTIGRLITIKDRAMPLDFNPFDDRPATSATFINGFEPSFANSQHINTPWSGGVFSFNYPASETASLLPSPTQTQICWREFLENVDQLAKVLHTPSAQSILRKAVSNPASLNNGQKALLFAIYFSSVSSMSAEDAEDCFKMDKTATLAMYRAATEQALTAADFLVTDDLITFQAFVLFLSFSHFAQDAKLVWALTGLARRLCISTSNSSPFTKEMHKRLKWQLWYLDRRASDDHGKDACSPDPMKDWELPLNINDGDIDPTMTVVPTPRKGWTEMSFCLIRFGIANTSRLLEGDLSQSQKERMINECGFKIQRDHLRYCDNSQAIHWLAQHVSYVMISEMWIKLYNDEWLSNNSSSGIHVTRNQILLTAIDIVDTPRRLEAEPQAKRWKWLLKAYLQYHPLAFLLNELCHSQQSETLERAWAVTESAFSRWTDDNKKSKNGEFLLEMMDKAKAIREKTIGRHPPQASLRSQEPASSLTDMTMAMVDTTYGGVEQMNDLAPFFPRESPFGHSPMTEGIPDDMGPLGYMTYTPSFNPGQYNSFNWDNNRSHLGLLDDNSEDIMLDSEYQF
ncbi:hypothetical protein V498_05812 [Pseudogymnoascus sp. VKM F-4517 (FW-2822)]|nr:hypothetical protein V498_05812 [Pseudogymnoascus sp. VKM F-4517 (FW-2822)]